MVVPQLLLRTLPYCLFLSKWKANDDTLSQPVASRRRQAAVVFPPALPDAVSLLKVIVLPATLDSDDSSTLKQTIS